MPLRTLESPATPEDTSTGQKPKTLPCRYCSKRFRRLEHVQRHERTHTKEKPFRCNCGKTFGRRDLLVRHEKLVHLNESSRDARNASAAAALAQMSPQNVTSAPNMIDPDLLMAQNPSYSSIDAMSVKPPENMMHHRAPGCSLDLLSDAANHLASSDLRMAPVMPPIDNRQQAMGNYGEVLHDPTPIRNANFQHVEHQGRMEDYNVLLDDFGNSNYFLPSSAFDSEVPVSSWSRPEIYNQPSGAPEHQPRHSHHDSQEDNNLFSRFGSRLPSLQPENGEENGRMGDDLSLATPPWKISAQDHREIQLKLDEFSSVLPKGFVLPSRHTLSRFIEGYVNGFHEHIPFLHIPTLTAINSAPELLLAIVAVGAQYRFESHRGNGLWYAAKAVAMEQCRRRNNYQVLEILSPTNYGSESVTVSPMPSHRHSSSHGHQDSHVHPELRGIPMLDSEMAQNDPRLKTAQARLETVQSLLLLMAMGSWGPKALLREALALQSQLALLIREQGLAEVDAPIEELTWEEWIRIEGDKRTKLIAYCFFNIHSIAYDMPPLLLTSEIKLSLPHSAREWKADNANAWREIRRNTPHSRLSFHDILGRLFAKSSPSTGQNQPSISSLGNYVLIHALIQHIFFVRQTSSMSNPSTCNNSLKPQDIEELGQALRLWQTGWDRTPESSPDPANPYGPVAFNATALLRLAYIRLHSDLGPCRKLDTRDPVRIAAALKGSPALVRSPRLSRAVLQSAHALSIPVKIGINFVARTQTFSWSIQHSLCNLECAFLLSKWLETIASSPLDLTPDERNLLEMVRSMLDETEFAVSFDSPPPQPSQNTQSNGRGGNVNGMLQDRLRERGSGALQNQGSMYQERGGNGMGGNDGGMLERQRIKQLGAAVVRLWAETFKGTHVFAIVKVIGDALDIYADLLEKDMGLGGMSINTGVNGGGMSNGFSNG